MAEIQDWQRQNQGKNGGKQPAPHQMNPKTMAYGSSMNAKIAKPTHECGGMVKMADGGMATRSVTSKTDGWAAHGSREFPKKFADGGMVEREAEDKAAGLKASAGEKVGFFERLRMGNIDDPKSEAYNRLGAGRAKADRDMESEAAAMKMVDDSRAAPAKAAEPDLGAFNEAGSGGMDEKEPGWDTKPSAPAPKPAARKAPVVASKPAASKPAAPAKSSGMSLSQRLGKEYAELEGAAQNAVKMPQATPESKARVRKMADDARKAYEAAADAEKTGRSVVLKR
jgi:hypothetical protein